MYDIRMLNPSPKKYSRIAGHLDIQEQETSLSAAPKVAAGIGKEGLPWTASECSCARNNPIISKLCQWSVSSRNCQPSFRLFDTLSRNYSHIPGLLVG